MRVFVRKAIWSSCPVFEIPGKSLIAKQIKIELLKNSELNAIKSQLDKLKLVLKSENAEQIVDEIKNLEKISEFYVERRMNASIKTLIEGKGVDDIL